MFHVNNDFSNANVPRTIRFTEEMHEELAKISQEKNISFNKLVLQCCRYALDHLDAKVEE